MLRPALGIILSLAVLLATALTNQAQGDKDNFLVKSWEGVVKKKSLLSKAPANGTIEDQETFNKVWKSWRPKSGKAPTIDFSRDVVYVYTKEGTRHKLGQFLSTGGQFRFVIVRGKGEPKPVSGFHYQIAEVHRKAVKSFNPDPYVADLNKK